MTDSDLRAAADKFRALFHASNTPAWVMARDGSELLEINQAALDFWGYDEEEFRKLRSEDVWVSRKRESMLRRLETEEQLDSVEVTALTKSGEHVPALLSVARVPIAGVETLLLQLFDLREVRRVERERGVALSRLEIAQRIARIGDFEWDGSEVKLSLALCELFGFDEIVPAERLVERVPMEVVEAVRRFASEEEGEARLELDHEITTEGGDALEVHLILQVESIDGHRTIRGTVQDISQQARAQRERDEIAARVQEAHRLDSLGVLAGGIAHDFNNLLAGMLGHAELARSEPDLSAEMRERLDDVVQITKRAADLTNQLLAYSGKGRFVVEAVDLSELIGEMANLLTVSIPKTHTLHYNLTPGLPAVEGDATQLRQVVMNLLLNASEAIEHDHGAIGITTGSHFCDAAYLESTDLAQEITPGEYVYFEISDNGKGIDKEALDRIFEPFFTTKFKGRGLGMAAIQGIVRGHQGALKIYTEPGRGTTVKVLFPASDQPVERARRPAEASPEAALSGAVLVIDDEPEVLRLAEMILERDGLRVFTASDGAEGLAVFDRHRDEIDLVLLDLTMPRLSGEDTFRELRRRKPDVRAILMSGYNEMDATQRFVGKGLAGFISKPFLVDDFREKIREQLG